jgi:hypothetical protein
MKGDLFLPDDLKAGERRPGIVLCHRNMMGPTIQGEMTIGFLIC